MHELHEFLGQQFVGSPIVRADGRRIFVRFVRNAAKAKTVRVCATPGEARQYFQLLEKKGVKKIARLDL